MPDQDHQDGLMPSILDRLTDPTSSGTVARRGYSIEKMIDAVQRDLNELLNTRQSHSGLSEDFVEVHRSIVGYGLPDLVSLNATTPQEREEIGRVIEDCVSRFEPRLRDVRATMLDAGDDMVRTVRFRIEARLCVDPAPEVAFDTILELATGHYSVKMSST